MNPIKTISGLTLVLLATTAAYAGSSFWGGFTGSLAGQAVGGIGKAIVHDEHCHHRPHHYQTRTVVVEEPVVIEQVVEKPVVVEKRVQLVDQTQALRNQNEELEDKLTEERIKNKKLQKQLAQLEEKIERLEKKVGKATAAA